MGLRLKWSVIAPLVEQLAYCKAPNVSRTVHRFMMLSSSHRPTGQGSTAVGPPHLLTLRTLALLLIIAVFSPVPGCAANQVPMAGLQRARYSGCNVVDFYERCQSLNRPEYISALSNTNSVLRIQRSQCPSMNIFLKCTVFNMACRSGRSRNLVVKVPCQTSCEQAVLACSNYLRDKTSWDHLRVTDCRFLPSGGCLDWTPLQNKKPSVAIHRNEFCHEDTARCQKMFPRKFKRKDWRRGNFTVTVDILIKSVMWFLQGSRVHTYFIAEVKRVFKSDIGLERGLQHTISWPFSCYCPGQLLVGRRYYLLSNSIKNAHEVNVSEGSVFLPRSRRYRRRFPCWTNRRASERRCSRKRRRDRRRRRRSTNKRRRFRQS